MIEQFIVVLYFLALILFIVWCCLQLFYTSNDPLIPHSDSHRIQIDNGSHITSTNSDLQNYSVPLDIVLNGSEYENMFNALHDQPHQSYNAVQTSRINISPQSQARIVQLSSNLNYDDINTISNVCTSFSRFPLDDPPPPSYDECMVSSRPKPRYTY